MAYTTTSTFGNAKTLLAGRLDDPSKVHWIDDELGRYVIESLRMWNSAAFWNRARASFSTIANQAFYDLTSTTDTGSGGTNPPAFLTPTIKDQDLVGLIEYHFIEPVNNWGVSTTWGGSDQFTMADLVSALQQRRDRFLLETGLILSHSTQAGPVTPTQTATLSGNIEDVRRLAWKRTSTGAFSPVFRDDLRMSAALSTAWVANPGTPKVYDIIMEAPTVIRLVPAPDAAGTLDLLTISAGATLDVSTGVLLGIPDDLAWGVKFGAMADLLGKDGQAKDPSRAEYCEARWNEAIELGKMFVSVLNWDIDGQLSLLSSVYELDTLKPTWQTSPSSDMGVVRNLGIAGWNMVGIGPTPINTSHTLTLDLLANMTVPTLDADQIQVGKEELGVIIDYAEHLARFKQGGKEFEMTMPHYERLMRMAMLNNDRLRANSKSFEILRVRKEYRQRPEAEEAA